MQLPSRDKCLIDMLFGTFHGTPPPYWSRMARLIYGQDFRKSREGLLKPLWLAIKVAMKRLVLFESRPEAIKVIKRLMNYSSGLTRTGRTNWKTLHLQSKGLFVFLTYIWNESFLNWSDCIYCKLWCIYTDDTNEWISMTQNRRCEKLWIIIKLLSCFGHK